ncbi:MAG: EAL domain-containing protein [Pseudomonadota bacterium]
MTRSACVLAVDDNPTIRKAISVRLSAKGFSVATACDGAQALQLIEDQPFDLVILDLQMPGIGGDEVLERIRHTYSENELPVIMLAASGDKSDINRTLELGANDYIVKPGDMPVLLARIKTQLTLKESIARLRVQETGEDAAEPIDRMNLTLDGPQLRADEFGHDQLRYSVIYDNTPMTCFTLDRDATILYANRFGLTTLGYGRNELEGRPALDLYVEEDRLTADEYLKNAIEIPGRLHRWEVRMLRRDGSAFWMRTTARAIGDNGNLMVLMTCEDIDDTYRLTEQLNFKSQHDDLTGLANRRMLEERLTQVIESAHAEGTEHSLAIVDLDQFKIINDTCGHDAGDELLRQLARILKSIVRKRDTIARIGGDEFAILIEDCPAQAARAAAEALRQAIENHSFSWEGNRHKLSASVGIVPINRACESTSNVLSMADTACYAAKDSGRNRIHTYQEDNQLVTTHHGEMRWATRINDALADDRFDLRFQAITPLQSAPQANGAHYELLVRMHDENGAIIMPHEFLPAAERYNLAGRLDRWVIARVFNWLAENPELLTHINILGINLSGQSIGNDEMLEFIISRFERSSISPTKFCFEITESAAISDLIQASRFIAQLKELGCWFALDDFGRGFSSLAYLKHLPVDFLKIDGAFVRDMANDSIDLAMVRAINEIGHVMGKKTIAEFVEDDVTLDELRAIGVDYAQGFHFGRPAPLDEILVA